MQPEIRLNPEGQTGYQAYCQSNVRQGDKLVPCGWRGFVRPIKSAGEAPDRAVQARDDGRGHEEDTLEELKSGREWTWHVCNIEEVPA